MFDILEGDIIIAPALLNITEFKVLYKRDKDRKKRVAFAELSYIYYLIDFKSPYRSYPAEERKDRIAIEYCDKALGDKWKADDKVKDAIRKYEELHVTPSLRYLESVEGQIGKVTNFLNGTLIDEETIKTIVDSIDKFNKIVLGLPKLKEAVQKEVSENSKIRGGGSTNLFED